MKSSMMSNEQECAHLCMWRQDCSTWKCITTNKRSLFCLLRRVCFGNKHQYSPYLLQIIKLSSIFNLVVVHIALHSPSWNHIASGYTAQSNSSLNLRGTETERQRIIHSKLFGFANNCFWCERRQFLGYIHSALNRSKMKSHHFFF